MRTLKNLAVLLVLLALTTEAVQAQRFTSKRRYWALGVSLNAVNYFGDIVPRDIKGSFDLGFTRPTFGGFAYRRLTPNIGFKAGMVYGTLTGDDYTSIVGKFGSVEAAMADPSAKFRLYRNLHFRNRIVEASGMFSYDFKGNKGFFYQRAKGFNPYITAGIAIAYSNPQAKGTITSPDQANTVAWQDLRPLATEAGKSYSPIVVSIPIGIGVKYKVNNKIDIGFEAAMRFTMTDYLDDVSGRFPSLDSLDAATAALSFRGEERYTYKGEDRSAIIQAMNDFYATTGTPGTAASIFAEAGQRRGNDGTLYDDATQQRFGLFTANDIYLVYGFNLYYMLGGGISCPKFR